MGTLIAALALALSLDATASAAARVPGGFVGMTVDGPLFDPGPNAGQFDKMVSSGVENIRVQFTWAAAQPYRSWSEVPAADASRFHNEGGVPTDFAPTDSIVGPAAQRGLTVLPVVMNAPGWDAAPQHGADATPPASDAPYANYMTALVHRYGPRGSFWRGRARKVPIRMWQVWNEPDLIPFWPVRPFEPSYVALLKAAHAAVKRADPGGKVVLAGMPNYSWTYLARIYKIPGGRGSFDVAAIHAYTIEPQGVITLITRLRRVMNRGGDARKPLLLTETGWPSSRGQSPVVYGFETTEAGQARKVAALLPLLARNRRQLGLLGFDFYNWAGVEYHNAEIFHFSGLFRFSGGRFIAKPAYSSFRKAALAIESCRQKGSLATRCVRHG